MRHVTWPYSRTWWPECLLCLHDVVKPQQCHLSGIRISLSLGWDIPAPAATYHRLMNLQNPRPHSFIWAFENLKPIQIGSRSSGWAASHTCSTGMTQEKLKFTFPVYTHTGTMPGNQEGSVLIQSPALTLGYGNPEPLEVVDNCKLISRFFNRFKLAPNEIFI